jgi:predicted MFS family arabinose efflux permease
MQMYSVVFNLFLRHYRISNLLIGEIVSSNLWGAAVLGSLLGLFADRIDKKKMLITLSLIQCTVLLMRALSISAIWQIAGAFVSGAVYSAILIVISASMILSEKHKNKFILFGSNFSISMIAGVLGNVTGGVMSDMFSERSTLIVASLIYATSLIALKSIPTLPAKQNKEKLSFNPFQRNIFWYYIISSMMVGFGAGLFINFGNLILNDLFNMSTTSIGLIMAFTQIATGAGGAINHILEKRFGPTKVLLVCYTSVVPLMISIAFVREQTIFSILYTLRFMLMNMVNPIFSVLIFSNIPAQMVSFTNGVGNLLNNSSRALAALLFGYIVKESSDYTKLLLISTIFYALNALLTYLLHKKLSFNPRYSS